MLQLLINDVIIGLMFVATIMILRNGKTVNGSKEDKVRDGYRLEMGKQWNRAERNKEIINYMDLFLQANQRKISFSEYFMEKGIRSIAIYGMSHLGKRLRDELCSENRVVVRYMIDKNGSDTESGIPVYTPEDEWQPVDAVVIAVVWSFDEIRSSVFRDVDCPVMNIEDILKEINKKKDV